MGRKVSDRFTVPLCRLHHRELHRRGNERAWWQAQSIDPLDVAAELWTATHAPETFFDQIRARELTDKLWDQRRNKECVAPLVETSFIAALRRLLRQRMLREVPTERPRELPDPWVPEPLHISDVIAHEYFDSKTTATRRPELNALLARCGITDEKIRATAMEMCGSSIQMFTARLRNTIAGSANTTARRSTLLTTRRTSRGDRKANRRQPRQRPAQHWAQDRGRQAEGKPHAYRHGLSTPLPVNPLNAARADALVEAVLGGDHAGVDNVAVAAAREFAQAQLELLRVRGIRTKLLSTIDATSAEALHRLVGIDRYETLAFRRRRRALRQADLGLTP